MQAPAANTLNELREALLRREQALRDEVHAADVARRTSARPDPTEVDDRKAEAEARQRAEIDAAQERRDLEELAQVEAALQRFAQGRYGECTDCGEAIGLMRLQAQPAALRCTACQERAERA